MTKTRILTVLTTLAWIILFSCDPGVRDVVRHQEVAFAGLQELVLLQDGESLEIPGPECDTFGENVKWFLPPGVDLIESSLLVSCGPVSWKPTRRSTRSAPGIKVHVEGRIVPGGDVVGRQKISVLLPEVSLYAFRHNATLFSEEDGTRFRTHMQAVPVFGKDDWQYHHVPVWHFRVHAKSYTAAIFEKGMFLVCIGFVAALIIRVVIKTFRDW